MLTLEHVKELVNDPSLSEEDIKKISDGFYTLLEIIYEHWMLEHTPLKKDLITSNLDKDNA